MNIHSHFAIVWMQDGIELPSPHQSDPSILSFTELHTSNSGVYTCIARHIIPEANVDISGSDTTIVVVQSMSE